MQLPYWFPIYSPAVAICAMIAYFLWWVSSEYSARRYHDADWRTWALPAVVWSAAINLTSSIALESYTLWDTAFDEDRFRSAMLVPYSLMLGGILNKKFELPLVKAKDVSRGSHAFLTVVFLFPWTMVNSANNLIEIALLGVGATLAVWLVDFCGRKQRGKWPFTHLIIPVVVVSLLSGPEVISAKIVPYHRLRQGPMILQSTDETCGAAAVASVAAIFGFRVSESDVLGTIDSPVSEGLSMRQIAAAFEAIGIRSEAYRFMSVVALIDYQNRVKLPVILHLIGSEVDHYVILIGSIDDRIVLGDPAWGIRVVNEADLEASWSRAAIVALPESKAVHEGVSEIIESIVSELDDRLRWALRLSEKNMRRSK